MSAAEQKVQEAIDLLDQWIESTIVNARTESVAERAVLQAFLDKGCPVEWEEPILSLAKAASTAIGVLL